MIVDQHWHTNTLIPSFFFFFSHPLSLSFSHPHTHTTCIHLFTGMMPDTFQSVCINCLAGYFCSDPRQPPQPCQTGTYSLSGNNTECTVCPAGYSCPFTNAFPQLCPSGSFSPIASTECSLCPAGSSCAQNASFPEPCLSGEFSQEGGKENHYIIILYLLNHCVLKVLVCMHDTTIHVRVQRL